MLLTSTDFHFELYLWRHLSRQANKMLRNQLLNPYEKAEDQEKAEGQV